ncbi:MAG TPA: HAMP domain-containing sensor histidine kinase [Polyangia bacterium]
MEVGTSAEPVRLAAVLRRERERILRDWEAAVRQSVSRSAALDRSELLDDMPSFVDRLIACVDDEAGESRKPAVDPETTGRHARHRLAFGVELRHLIHEYRLLRRILLRCAVDARCEATPQCLEQLLVLNDLIDEALSETASAYGRERDAARDLVLGVIGHDLRNPLAAVSVASSLIAEATSLEQVRAVGQRIKRSADRIHRVIGDLLDLARSRFGARMPIAPEPLDLGEVARNAIEELQLAHPDRRIVVERRGDVAGSWDRARLGQVVSNLVANAIQHGSDPIRVAVEGDGDSVVLRIANQGTPIPKESLPSLFDPFRRLPAGGDDTARLGLGLYIVAEIVRRHGGSVNVQSTPAETAFTVRLPRRPIA